MTHNTLAHDLAAIHIDPLLGEISELLHRMELCRTREPFQWMASDALRKLQQYEEQQRCLAASAASQPN